MTGPRSSPAIASPGAVDRLEAPPDLLPPLRRDRNLVVAVNDQTGVVPILRFNSLYRPFDNAAVRRAVLSAVKQAEFLQAFSDDPASVRTGVGIFCPGTPMASMAGLDGTVGTPSLQEARRAIEAAGCKSERVVMLEPTDHPVNPRRKPGARGVAAAARPHTRPHPPRLCPETPAKPGRCASGWQVSGRHFSPEHAWTPPIT
jgi:peptide/nickel transport system substrate-binding protein